MKVNEKGKKYYGFVLNHSSASRRTISEGGGKSARIASKLIFVVNDDGPETAAEIRNTINNTLFSTMSKNLVDLEKTRTFVVDCVATMPAVFGSSVSQA